MIRYEARGPVAWLTLDRPEKLNAMSRASSASCARRCGTRRRRTTRSACVVFHGAGQLLLGRRRHRGFRRARRHRPNAAPTSQEALGAFRAVEELPSRRSPPSTGMRLGGGCELTMVCDLVVADETARFGTPETAVGLFPGPGVVRGRAHLDAARAQVHDPDRRDARRRQAPRGRPRQRGRPGGRAPREGRGVGGDDRRSAAARARGREGDPQPRGAGSATPTSSTRSRCSREATTTPRASPRSPTGGRRSSRADEQRQDEPEAADGGRLADLRAPARGRARRWAAPSASSGTVRPGGSPRASASTRSSTRAPGSSSACSRSPSTAAPSPAPADAVVTGLARIDGRKVCVLAVDATVLAGTTAQVNMRKQNRRRALGGASAACR